MLMPISRAAEELGLTVPDLVVLIRNLPGAPYVVRGDMLFADPAVLGPFLAEHGIAIDERYAGPVAGSAGKTDDEELEDDDVEESRAGGRRRRHEARARR